MLKPLRKLWSRGAGLVETMEELPLGPGTLLLVLGGIICIRNLLEIAIAQNPVYTGLATFVHYPLAYVGPFLALTLVLSFWSRIAPARIARLMLFAWLLTLTPPLTDFLLAHHSEAPTIGYLQIEPADMGWVFANFFNPAVDLEGTTLGIRVETAAAVILGAFFVLLRAGSALRALGAAISIYCTSLFFFTLPTIVLFLARMKVPGVGWSDLYDGEGRLIRPSPDSSPDSTAICWLVPLLTLLACFWWWLEKKSDRDGWLYRRFGRPALPGASLLLAMVSLAGLVSAGALYFPGDTGKVRAPFDDLAPPAMVLGIGLLATAIRVDPRKGRDRVHHEGVAPIDTAAVPLLVLGGLCIAAGLGTSVALGMLTAAGALTACRLPTPPGIIKRLVSSIAVGIATLGAFSAGYSLLIGGQALARLPFRLLLPGLVLGLVYGWMAGGERNPRWWLPGVLLGGGLGIGFLFLGEPALVVVTVPAGLAAGWLGGAIDAPGETGHNKANRLRWTGALAGIVFVLSMQGVIGAHAGDEHWQRQVRCIARLERLEAFAALSSGNTKEAKIRFNRAIECDPKDVEAHRGLGLVSMKEGKLNPALKKFRRALELAPNSVTEISNLAAALLEARQPEEAWPMLRQIRARDPRNVNIRFNYAQCLTMLGDRRDEAIAAWQELIDLASGRPGESATVASARRYLRTLRRGGSPEFFEKRKPVHPQELPAQLQ